MILDTITLKILLKYAKQCHHMQDTIWNIPKKMVSDGVMDKLEHAQGAMLLACSRKKLLKYMIDEFGEDFTLNDVSIETFNIKSPEYASEMADFFYMANLRRRELVRMEGVIL